MIKHINIEIYGFVQRIGFRYWAKYIAEKLKINGFVRNNEDGSVYIEAEGKGENIEKFIDWCKRGPPVAKVEKIIFKYSDEIKNFSDFKILWPKDNLR